MKRKIKLQTVSIYYSKESRQILLWSSNHDVIFNWCYQNKRNGQVVKKAFTYPELMAMKSVTPELRGNIHQNQIVC